MKFTVKKKINRLGLIKMSLIIGTRKSKLAQWQADRVITLLKEKFPEETFEKLLVLTEGDKRLDVTLDKIGGKDYLLKR